MIEFVLKTETERRLYVESLLHCLDRGTLTDKEVLQDLDDLLRQRARTDSLAQLATSKSQLEGFVVAYKRGHRDRGGTCDVMLQVMDNLAVQ